MLYKFIKCLSWDSIIAQSFFFLFVIFLITCLLLQLVAIWPFTIDDMYITLRYADHWHQGHGLTWNIGEIPLEGYSNFSFVVFARLAWFLGLDAVTFLKLIGVLGLVSSMIAVYCLTRFFSLSYVAWIPCFWLASYQGEIVWSVSGLETTFYQALLCFSVVLIVYGVGYRFHSEELKTHPQQSLNQLHFPALSFAGLCMCFASMTRPEAPIVLLGFLVILVIQKRPWKGVLLLIVAFLLPYLGYFVWRLGYFGYLFPNPVYCKVNTLENRFVLDRQYLQLIWPFVVLILAGLWVKSKKMSRYSLAPFLWLPSVIYCALLIYADPIVAFDNRLFLPAFALLLPLSFYGLQRLIGENQYILILVSLLFAALFIPMKSLKGYQNFTKNPIQGEQLREQVALWLSSNTKSHDRIVLGDSGYIPYRIQRHFIDSYCLNSSIMSHMPVKIRDQAFCEKIFLNQPEVIILTSLVEQGHTIYTPVDACLVKKLSHNQHYHSFINFRTWNQKSFYRYEIYQKIN